MKVKFSKYEGTGNDFLLLDNLAGKYNELSITQIQKMCQRRFGIGADGLIKINASEKGAFEMDYYNADGSKSFCGNGARCAVEFAGSLGISVENVSFDAIDGLHTAFASKMNVRLKIIDVIEIQQDGTAYVLYTGSPHYVQYDEDLSTKHIISLGRSVRFSPTYNQEGINVNLVKVASPNEISIATYERGVEDETLSCGTGATACAIVQDFLSETPLNEVIVKVKGGELKVQFERFSKGIYREIYLSGPATFVYSGEIDV
ncbi:MAG: diaminopimelate epimerase [Crocinitomicaceae bacterium]|nr:diaminopimelate epimerase [Crocinitomicaceae bacterium]